MNKLFIFIITLHFLSSCQNFNRLDVSVSNPLDFERLNETIEIDWAVIQRHIPNVQASEISVFDEQSKAIVAQTLYKGEANPQSLIFQVSVSANGKSVYSISRKKEQNAITPEASSVGLMSSKKPEFVWHNNKVSYCAYGLVSKTHSKGIDICKQTVKSTEQSEKQTLGYGALAPYINHELILGDNFAISKIIDSGAVRITFELTYPPISIQGTPSVEKRRISLDANEYLNNITEMFIGAPTMSVATGITKSTKKDSTQSSILNHEKGYIICAQNIDIAQENVVVNKELFATIVIPSINPMQEAKKQGKHILGIATYHADDPFTYYSGVIWNEDNTMSIAQCEEYIKRYIDKLNQPLQVRLK
ncbi:MAG: DUF4861 family protein [Bacteroidales bacterium]